MNSINDPDSIPISEISLQGATITGILDQKKMESVKKGLAQIQSCNVRGTTFTLIFDYKGEKIKALLTNEHVVSKENIKNKEEIIITPFCGIPYKIKLDDTKRLIKAFETEKEDCTIIQLLDTDNFDKDVHFFEIDEHYETDGPKFYRNKSINCYHYPIENENELVISQGTIMEVNEKNGYYIAHNASTDHGSSGGVLVFGKDLKAVAIHRGRIKNKDEQNAASLLKNIVDKLNGKIYKNKHAEGKISSENNNLLNKKTNKNVPIQIEINQYNSVISINSLKKNLISNNPSASNQNNYSKLNYNKISKFKAYCEKNKKEIAIWSIILFIIVLVICFLLIYFLIIKPKDYNSILKQVKKENKTLEEMKIDIKNQEKYTNEILNEILEKLDKVDKTSFDYEDGNYKGKYNGEYMYFGLWKKPNGFGEYKCNNGDYYKGQWVEGKRHGYGIQYYWNNNQYRKGYWENNKLNGFAISESNSRIIYEGKWVNHNYEGKGIYYYENGDFFIGSFTNNKFNGHGGYYFNSGEEDLGEYYNDNLQKGYFYFSSKNIFEGERQNEDLYIGTYYYKDGTKKKCKYVREIVDGEIVWKGIFLD